MSSDIHKSLSVTGIDATDAVCAKEAEIFFFFVGVYYQPAAVSWWWQQCALCRVYSNLLYLYFKAQHIRLHQARMLCTILSLKRAKRCRCLEPDRVVNESKHCSIVSVFKERTVIDINQSRRHTTHAVHCVLVKGGMGIWMRVDRSPDPPTTRGQEYRPRPSHVDRSTDHVQRTWKEVQTTPTTRGQEYRPAHRTWRWSIDV